jgi:hypothetical protein
MRLEVFSGFETFMGVARELITAAFEFGGQNRMFDAVCNSTLWPLSFFRYTTGELRTMIPTAYYQFKLETNVQVKCSNNQYETAGVVGEGMLSNQLAFRLKYACTGLV